MKNAFRLPLGRNRLVLFAGLLLAGVPGWSDDGGQSKNWSQWGQNPQHTGTLNVTGQRTKKLLDDVVYDPFVAAEKADPTVGEGDLHVHYQVPLTDGADGDDVYMEFKTGAYTSALNWNSQTWNEKKLRRSH